MVNKHQVIFANQAANILLTGYSFEDLGELTADLTLPTGPTGDGGVNVAWSLDGKCLVLFGYRASGLPSNSDYMFLRRKGKTWVSSPFTPIPINGVSGARLAGVSLSRDGTYMYASVNLASPYGFMYKRVGTTWSRLTDFVPPVAAQNNAAIFSADDAYLFFAYGANLYMMKRTGDTWAQVSSVPVSTFAGNMTATSDGQFLVCVEGGSGSKVLTFYAIGVDTLTKHATLAVGDFDSFTMDDHGEYLALNARTSESWKFLKRTGKTFAELSKPSGLMVYTTNNTGRVAMTGDGRHLFLTMSHTSPYMQYLTRTDDTWTLRAAPSKSSGLMGLAITVPTILAGQFSFYDSALYDMMSGGASLPTLKLMLLGNDAEFVAGHTALSQVTNSGAYEVYGQGWPQGGIACPASLVDAGSGIVDLVVSDVSQAMSGVITPYAAVIYDDANGSDRPLAFIQFEEAVPSVSGEALTFDFPPRLVRFGALGTAEVS